MSIPWTGRYVALVVPVIAALSVACVAGTAVGARTPDSRFALALGLAVGVLVFVGLIGGGYAAWSLWHAQRDELAGTELR
jgi:hypothetical protein